MLSFRLYWFLQEDDGNVILKIAQLIQVIGGHSIAHQGRIFVKSLLSSALKKLKAAGVLLTLAEHCFLDAK